MEINIDDKSSYDLENLIKLEIKKIREQKETIDADQYDWLLLIIEKIRIRAYDEGYKRAFELQSKNKAAKGPPVDNNTST